MIQNHHFVASLLQLLPRTFADAFLLRKVGVATGLTLLIGHCWLTMWVIRRYFGPMRKASIARTSNFWISKLGTAPPPNDKETKDELSAFLIRCAQDASQQPFSVCWSVMGTPLVILNSLQSIKDVLIDAQLKKSGNGKPAAQRGSLINKIQNIVFGGKNINNTVGEEWRWRRLIMGRPFSTQQLTANHLPFVITRVRELISTIQQAADTKRTLELDDVFMDLTMDVINQYLYGRSADHELKYSIVGGKSNLKVRNFIMTPYI
jgi:cytochrome P450